MKFSLFLLLLVGAHAHDGGSVPSQSLRPSTEAVLDTRDPVQKSYEDLARAFATGKPAPRDYFLRDYDYVGKTCVDKSDFGYKNETKALLVSSFAAGKGKPAGLALFASEHPQEFKGEFLDTYRRMFREVDEDPKLDTRLIASFDEFSSNRTNSLFYTLTQANGKEGKDYQVREVVRDGQKSYVVKVTRWLREAVGGERLTTSLSYCN